MTKQAQQIDKLLFDYDLIEVDKNCLNNISGALLDAIIYGRQSVLDDFEAVTMADAFMGLSITEWQGVRKFFAINKELTKNQ